jgi:HlyD family secretion protein
MDRVIKKSKWSAQRIALYVGIPLLAAVLMAMLYQTAGASKLRVQKERLSLGTVVRGAFQENIPINGTVLPIKTVFVDAIEGGQVKEVYLEGGEMVKKGEMILKLSNPSLELNSMNLETQLLEQMNNLRNTRITMEENGLNLKEQLLQIDADLIDQKLVHSRNQVLFKDSVISESEYLETKNAYEYSQRRRNLLILRIEKDSLLRSQQIGQVESSLALGQRNLNAISASLEFLTIRAPIDGQMSSVRVEIGETVSQGQNLGQIDVLDGFKVRARIDEHYISRVTPGLQGGFTFSGEQYGLVIRKVYPEVVNGAFEVDMEFDGSVPDGIKRNQNLQIRLALTEEKEALLIPRGGFFNKTGGNWIYVVDEASGVAYKREIRIGNQSDRSYEVLEGLDEGETVVTSSYDAYNDIDQLILQ